VGRHEHEVANFQVSACRNISLQKKTTWICSVAFAGMSERNGSRAAGGTRYLHVVELRSLRRYIDSQHGAVVFFPIRFFCAVHDLFAAINNVMQEIRLNPKP
jgi:hypothetical protein